MAGEDLPTVEDIHEIHELIAQQWALSHRGTRVVLPDQTLRSLLDDIRDIDGEYRRAAALLNRLAEAHVYEDGNKRTAWTVAETYLTETGNEAIPSDESAERVLLHRRRFDEAELATWLETGEIPDQNFRDSYPPRFNRPHSLVLPTNGPARRHYGRRCPRRYARRRVVLRCDGTRGHHSA